MSEKERKKTTTTKTTPTRREEGRKGRGSFGFPLDLSILALPPPSLTMALVDVAEILSPRCRISVPLRPLPLPLLLPILLLLLCPLPSPTFGQLSFLSGLWGGSGREAGESGADKGGRHPTTKQESRILPKFEQGAKKQHEPKLDRPKATGRL